MYLCSRLRKPHNKIQNDKHINTKSMKRTQTFGAWRSCLFLLCCLWIGLSCQNSKGAEELFAERASGVVLVRSEFYFKVYSELGETFYFSDIERNGKRYDINNLTDEAGDIEKVTHFGSGFFISKEGDILTAKNVVFGDIPVLDLQDAVERAISAKINNLDDLLSEAEGAEIELRDNIKELQSKPQSAEVAKQIQQTAQWLRDNLDSQRELMGSIQKMRQGRNKRRIELVCTVGILYTGADEADLQLDECVVRNITLEPNLDLALLQLKSKQTPKDCYIFDPDDYVRVDDIRVGQRAYMIGFNEGVELARTGKGLKPQITSGEISRDANVAAVLYTIPTLEGSSGSPVMDEKGRLLAINCAGMPDVEGFNWGVAMSAGAAFYLESCEHGAQEFRLLPSYGRIADEPEQIDNNLAEEQLQHYYTNLYQNQPKLALRAFSPTAIKQYHRMSNTNRNAILPDLLDYLKKYEVLGFRILEVGRKGNQSFNYKMELDLERRSDNMLLYYHIEGELSCAKEEDRIYITSINDKANKLLKQEPKPQAEQHPSDEENYPPQAISEEIN